MIFSTKFFNICSDFLEYILSLSGDRISAIDLLRFYVVPVVNAKAFMTRSHTWWQVTSKALRAQSLTRLATDPNQLIQSKAYAVYSLI